MPKISSYLDTGTIVEEAEDARKYPNCKYITHFMKEFSGGRSEDECFRILEKSKYASAPRPPPPPRRTSGYTGVVLFSPMTWGRLCTQTGPQ